MEEKRERERYSCSLLYIWPSPSSSSLAPYYLRITQGSILLLCTINARFESTQTLRLDVGNERGNSRIDAHPTDF